ncbi:hypothetical protein [Sphingomonas nostoxanthinifaciens]|uniref:hypothetical protein n=1 Tax=Sphingomonas nostoxanthinifaciens TaxID=2872652 RepID=UPI001CC20DBE|nr:hypothetical protein [Sphingomonas nostoxanthinifaciens]UAK25318.1 hypothetical protein K8P63_03785 [Sphingomonas nostoxanthinifaciens]
MATATQEDRTRRKKASIGNLEARNEGVAIEPVPAPGKQARATLGAARAACYRRRDPVRQKESK